MGMPIFSTRWMIIKRTADWPHSTFHRYVRDRVYTPDWAAAMESTVQGNA